MSEATIICEEAHRVDAVVVDGRVMVGPEVIEAVLGYRVEARGLCRGDECVVVRDGSLRVGDKVDIGAVAEVLGRQVVIEPCGPVVAIALDAELRRRALEDLDAPVFELPDLDGVSHALAEWRGKKRLLVTFASWCGCRYDLPGWQQLHDELKGDGFTAIAVAIDDSAEDVRPWVQEIDFPVLVDSQHVLTELYAISNVPTVIWIDEDDRIVRPNGVAFGTDTFKDFTGVEAGPHLDAVRRWVREDTLPLGADEARRSVGQLTEDEVRARLHFRVAASLRRQGDTVRAGPGTSRPQRGLHPTTSRCAGPPCLSWVTIPSARSSSPSTRSGRTRACRITGWQPMPVDHARRSGRATPRIASIRPGCSWGNRRLTPARGVRRAAWRRAQGCTNPRPS